MEFHEKLTRMRREAGLTQEELAARLYVSRTAVSKWESGRGYPNLESLKAIAALFSVTVDKLLSSEEILTVAEETQRQTEKKFRDPVLGLLDLCMLSLLFLPLFGMRGGDGILATSLLMLSGVKPYVRGAYFGIVIAMSVMGILTLALQGCGGRVWEILKARLSLALGVVAVLLFMITQQPYAAMLAFSLLIIKTSLLIKRR